MSHHDEYRQWPFLTQEEFELACAFFDQKYIRAKLGPKRRMLKIRPRRAATTGASFIEILRLIQLPEDEGDLSRALEKLGGDVSTSEYEMEIDSRSEDADEVSVGLHVIIRAWTNLYM
jgi:ubiquitin-like-conjugating enzyme ATG10